MSSNPLVSILLPVFNGQAFLSEAIESMLSQSYKNFELIVIDDQSTDSSLRIAESYKDPRIRVIRNKKNLGTGVSLNRALAFAKDTMSK